MRLSRTLLPFLFVSACAAIGRTDTQRHLACERGSEAACLLMGDTELRRGARGREPALRYFGRACTLGSSRACAAAGDLWAGTPGPTPDWDEAQTAYTRGCSLGSADACLRLGELAEVGLGRSADIAAARDLFTRACTAGDETGCRYAQNLARMGAPGCPEPAELPADASTSRPLVGGLDKDAIAPVMHAGSPAIKACYEQALALKPDLAGKVKVRFSIASGGEVTAVQLAEHSLPSAPLVSCILHAVRGYRFPVAPLGARTCVTYPYEFKGRPTR